MIANADNITRSLLHDTGSCLTVLEAAEILSQHDSIALPRDLEDWLVKWRLVIEHWLQEQNQLHIYCYSSETVSLDWQQLIAGFGTTLADVWEATRQLNQLAISHTSDSERIFSMVYTALVHLSEVQRLITSREYEHFYQ